MRQGRLRPGQAGHVEGQCLGAAGPHQPLEAQREVRFGDTGQDLGKQRGKGPIGDRAGRGDPLDLGRFLRRSVGLQPTLHRDELHSWCGGRQATPDCVRHQAGLDRDPARTDRVEQIRPSRRQVVVCLELAGLRRLPARLDRVARVGQHRDLVPADQELAGVAGDLLFAIGQRETGQVAHVLATDAEVRVDSGAVEPCPQPRETSWSSRPVRRVPRGEACRRWRSGEVRRVRPMRQLMYPYFFRLASCSAIVFAKACAPSPSGMARK